MATFIQRVFGPGATMSQAFGNNVIATVNGQGINIVGNSAGSMHTLPTAHHIKVIALDQDKRELDSFTLPVNSAPTLVVKAEHIDSLSSTSADVIVKKCGDIDLLKTASGDITIEECKSVGAASTMSGDVTINSAEHTGNASSMSGNVRVTETKRDDNQVRRGRDKSPKRKHKAE